MLEATAGRCFACGANNPIGLRLEFRVEGEEYVTDFTPRGEHQGYDDMVHGGLVATVLDEVMARFLWELDLPFATAELTVRYKRPLAIGARCVARGRIEKQTGRLIEMSSQLEGADGTVYATARGTFLPVRSRPSAAT